MKLKNKKTIFILLTIIIIILFLPISHFIKLKNAKIIVELKNDLKVEFLKDIKISDLITYINGKIINDEKIDTTKLGTQTIKFKYINEDNLKIPYQFNIEVVDNIPPVVLLSGNYTIYQDNKFDYSKILCGDNEDNHPNCFVTGEYDETKIGTYPLVFKAIDRSQNETSINFNLRVISKPKTTSQTNPTVTYFSDVYNEFKNSQTKIGIDVSGWQGEIDFAKLKNAGVEFIIIKVGGTVGTNADYYVDSKFINNIKQANEYDIDVGIYFYSYANSEEGAKKDALWLLDQIKDYKVTLPIAFDWEDWNSFNDYNLSFYNLTNMANTFIQTVEEAGYKGMLYSSKTYLEKLWLPTNHDIWLAHYTNKTNYQGYYLFWQICNDGIIDGINGAVDIDIMYLK